MRAECIITKTYKTTHLRTSLADAWANHIVINLIAMHRDVPVVALRRCVQKLMSGQITTYCKKLLASRTNSIVLHIYVQAVLLRCCFILRSVDKSDRIGIQRVSLRRCVIVYFQISFNR